MTPVGVRDVTLEAAQWLEDIYDYIASENPTPAHQVVAGIYEKIQLLRTHRHLHTCPPPRQDFAATAMNVAGMPGQPAAT